MERAKLEMTAEGFAQNDIAIERSLDMRYQGQAYEINVPLTPAYIEDFHNGHQRLYGHSNVSRMTEVVNVRVDAAGITQRHVFPAAEAVSRPFPMPATTRQVWFGEGFWETAIYHRDQLLPGMESVGPAIVSGGESTVVITPNFRFRIDGVGTLVATRSRAAERKGVKDASVAAVQ